MTSIKSLQIGKNSLSIQSVVETIFPIGSYYLTESNLNPSTILGIGTWAKVAENQSLYGSSNDHSAGSTSEAGLPNITGQFNPITDVLGGLPVADIRSCKGAFGTVGTKANPPGMRAQASDEASYNFTFDFNASRSSAVYGKSNTVQPPARYVNIWKRVG